MEMQDSIARQVNKRNIFPEAFVFLILMSYGSLQLPHLEIHLFKDLGQFILRVVVNDDLAIAIAAVL